MGTGLQSPRDASVPDRAAQRMIILLQGQPAKRDRAGAGKRHTDFRFDVWQEVGNPPRGVGLPINQ